MENINDGCDIKEEKGAASESFDVPPNIKQIGMLDERVKIYIEDYVYTYLNEFAKEGGNRERLAVLVGKHINIDTQEIVVISGAVEGRDTVFMGDVEEFTDDSYSFINSQIDTYFKDLSIVGWLRTQPGFGAFISPRDESFHKICFKYSWQLVYIVDPIEKMSSFYVYNSDRTDVVPARGYFIYYDKNRNMQDYMVNLDADPVLAEDRIPEDIPVVGRRDSEYEDEDMVSKVRDMMKERLNASKKGSVYAFGAKSALAMLSILLFTGLLSSMMKIKRLENDISAIKSSYGTIVQIAEGKTLASVYGPQGSDYDAGDGSVQVSAGLNSGAPSGESTSSEGNSVYEETKEVLKEAKPEIFEEALVPEYYVVEAGDTLEYISRKFYGDRSRMKDIMQLNDISDPDKIYFGFKIKLPR